MITLQALSQNLEELFADYMVEDFCPNGLQVEGKAEINFIATAVSASLETIHEALDRGVDALIVHHGLFWQKDPYPITGPKKEKIALLLKAGISLFAYHLPLDAHQEIGNNWTAAKEMGWQAMQPFSIGVQGQVSPCSPEAFQSLLETYYSHKATVSFAGERTIKKAALVSGGAYKMLDEAKRAGCDAFITGNFDEPAWYMAKEWGIHFYALGHSATERIGPKALAKVLDAHFIDNDNPF